MVLGLVWMMLPGRRVGAPKSRDPLRLVCFCFHGGEDVIQRQNPRKRLDLVAIAVYIVIWTAVDPSHEGTRFRARCCRSDRWGVK